MEALLFDLHCGSGSIVQDIPASSGELLV